MSSRTGGTAPVHETSRIRDDRRLPAGSPSVEETAAGQLGRVSVVTCHVRDKQVPKQRDGIFQLIRLRPGDIDLDLVMLALARNVDPERRVWIESWWPRCADRPRTLLRPARHRLLLDIAYAPRSLTESGKQA